ncbi:hypothetical protein [uncultured Fibrobacter sp.]|uniref:hypothetical protein n=1 Tax=uncultured Fibrobacter sp. TaxID=261512 RepID=UPI0025F9289D|nr:hypothetical protein [uncultured Fibrobacter sp.]
MEIASFVIGICSLVLSIIAIVITIWIARTTVKIQFLQACFIECMEVGRISNGKLDNYEERRNALLDKIYVLGDDFKQLVDEYRTKEQGTDIDTDVILKKIDKLFNSKLQAYKKYIKV